MQLLWLGELKMQSEEETSMHRAKNESVEAFIKKLEKRQQILKDNLNLLRNTMEEIQKELDNIDRTLKGLKRSARD